MKLNVCYNNSFAVTMRLECEECQRKYRPLGTDICRATKKIDLLDRSKKGYLGELNKLSVKIWRNKKRRNVIEDNLIKQTILPNTIRSPQQKLASLKYKFINYELNIRAVMTAYFLGVGGSDIGRTLSMLGVCGDIGYEKKVYKILTHYWICN